MISATKTDLRIRLSPTHDLAQRTAHQKWRGLKALVKAVVPSQIVVWRGPRRSSGGVWKGKRRIALTFDDGPDDLTLGYLSVLERWGARATFFVVGEACVRRPDLVAAIADAGHELAGHGYTHRRFPTLTASELSDELVRTAALLPANAGRRLVRPPHGAVSLSSLYTCARAGFTTVLWSHDSGDWCTTQSTKVLAAFAEQGAREPDAIVLLHEGQAWTMAALPAILRDLNQAGHELVTLHELLDA
ncbi:MAG TPA: polysaccharide deacetylase family protein [Polyangiaceae bacterium]|jgi:peptidoglycan/xylan/chitin deacetylase (PgdA/CDA1 family)|nr:polysaccharide deacetylase family protein [Polyangiaceae bacterium]